ncbi:hypothetical protein D9611_001002 [Ephemerocybe angulata]|uniref:F-box domain-containing protein n=1 Tax=Ephemerocybe angulata TaxID=980116 RepID=A0A8H5BP11_9AGAR|nr:hypothetical protein D9611_001002 [Tulosesus angulatus]
MSLLLPSLRARLSVTSKALSGVLNSNDFPSTADASSANGIIGHLSSRIDALMLEVKALEAERIKYLSVVSSVRRIPMELLSEIFLLTAPATRNSMLRKTVITLQLVCRRWRDVALITHGLWAELVIAPCWSHSRPKALDFSRSCHHLDQDACNDEHYHEYEYEMITSWLSRAGSLPRRLGYRNPRPCPCSIGGKCVAVHPTVVKLLTHGPPVDHFALCLPSAACFRSWVESLDAEKVTPRTSMPWLSLRSLTLILFEGDSRLLNNAEDPSRSVFSLLPPLSSFGLCLPARGRGYEIPFSPPLNVPTTTLARLSTFSIRWDWGGSALFKLISQCDFLESLTVDLGNTEPFDLDDNAGTLANLKLTPLEIVHLREFRLRDGSFKILEFIRVPELISLNMELNLDREETQLASSALTSFLTSSNIVNSIETIR